MPGLSHSHSVWFGLVALNINCERCSDFRMDVRRRDYLAIEERSTRFGADNIRVGFEMVTRKLRVTNFWPGLIAALTVLWSVVSSRVRLVCRRAVEGRGKRSRCLRLRPAFSQIPYSSATRVASDRPRWQAAWSRCWARLACKLRSQREPNDRTDTKSLLEVDPRSDYCILAMTSHPRWPVPRMLT
jgi:hypothetical protein